MVRGRSFTYDPDTDRLADALPGHADAESAGEEGGFTALWRQMFESEDGAAQLRPGGRFYSDAARSLGVPAAGPLNPSFEYEFPNPFMQYVGDDRSKNDHTLHFSYDVSTDQLVYSHAGKQDKLQRQSSAQLQGEASRSWRRDDFLQPACLRPGGLLYKNAMDSFGELTQEQHIIFPHFGPIKDDVFRYRADIDALVPHEESDFIQGGIIAPGSGSGTPSGFHGSSIRGHGSVLGSATGGRGSVEPLSSLPTEPEPEPHADSETGRAMTDAERAREARNRRYGGA
jgi:hypothetical protein